MTDFRFDGPACGPVTVVLAHGAGNPMDAPFLEAVARGLAAGGQRVARFEFPYMARRRVDGVTRPPDPLPILRQAWLQAIADLGGGPRLVIGGKSMGGRIASLVADESGVRGLACLGYPFHPVGKPERTRIQHLAALRTRTLVLQGERDPFGTVADVAAYPLSPAVTVRWIPDGDHSWTPRVSSGRAPDQGLREGIDALLGFVRELS